MYILLSRNREWEKYLLGESPGTDGAGYEERYQELLKLPACRVLEALKLYLVTQWQQGREGI